MRLFYSLLILFVMVIVGCSATNNPVAQSSFTVIEGIFQDDAICKYFITDSILMANIPGDTISRYNGFGGHWKITTSGRIGNFYIRYHVTHSWAIPNGIRWFNNYLLFADRLNQYSGCYYKIVLF